MAIYMCSVKVIKRSEGKSIVAASAYRSGENIENIWDGTSHNYTKKQWIEYKEIMIPDHAPKSYLDRATLWNAVEMSEKASDARLGKEVLIALPREMTLDEQIALVRDYVKSTFIDDGMCADISIHNPPLRNDLGQPIDYNNNVITDSSKYIYQNPHAHILLTMRPIDSTGKWEGKSCIEYVCKCNGIEKALTAAEYKKYKSQGWEKQYKFMNGKTKLWLTMSEGNALGLKRVNKSPKTSPHGRTNPTVARWESPRTIYNWRQSWESVANKHLEKNGYPQRITCSSYKAQGKEDYIPTVHIGHKGTNMIRRANRTGNNIHDLPETVQLNIEISKHNALVKKLTIEINQISEKIAQLSNDTNQHIEELKNMVEKKTKEKNELNIQLLEKKYKLIKLQENLSLANNVINRVNSANQESAEIINTYELELQALGMMQGKKKAILKDKILQENKKTEARNTYMANTLRKCNITSAYDINKLMNEYTETDIEARELNDKIAICIEQLQHITDEYFRLLGDLHQINTSNKIPKKIR